MDNFIYSLNATLPIFLMILLGKVLIKLKIIDLPFTKVVDRFVFVVALPVLLFKDLTANDLSKDFNGGYVLFCFVVTLVSISAIWFFTSIFMKNKEEQGAFIQASYRSSAAILGLAFINNMYDSTGLAPLMILGAVPLFNIFAVVILTLKGDNNGQKPDVKTTVINILKNPILLGILISLPFAFFHVQFPAFVDKALTSIGNTATPLALISIGATFEGRQSHSETKTNFDRQWYQVAASAGSVSASGSVFWLSQPGTDGHSYYAGLSYYGILLYYGQKYKERCPADFQRHRPYYLVILRYSYGMDLFTAKPGKTLIVKNPH